MEIQRDIWVHKGIHGSIEENMITHIDTKELGRPWNVRERRDYREYTALYML